MKIAFLASGAAAQLIDAALAGENTRQLAGRIAIIARRLSGAAGAAVHLKTAAGLQMLGCDGEPCPPDLVARGVDSAYDVVNGWMHSPEHRHNILDCSLDQMGIGVAIAGDRRRTIYWVEDFATPR